MTEPKPYIWQEQRPDKTCVEVSLECFSELSAVLFQAGVTDAQFGDDGCLIDPSGILIFRRENNGTFP